MSQPVAPAPETAPLTVPEHMRKYTPRQFFETYTGRIVCDACRGYAALETPHRLLCGCWAHVRRKFYEAWKIGRHPEAPGVLDIIRTLYALEREVPTESEHDPQRLSIRQQQSGPLLESLQELLEAWKPRVLPAGKLGVAIGYALNNWPPPGRRRPFRST